MDNTTNNAASERTADERAWDAEFREEQPQSGWASDVKGLVKFAVRLPVALIQMPMALVPDETARHARRAAHESFLAFRTLMSAMGDGIERMLEQPADAPVPGEVQGPAGTWGTAPAAHTSPKVKKVEIMDDSSDLPAGDLPTVD
jgi:hypothetical protein